MRPLESIRPLSASQNSCAKSSARRSPGRNSVMKRAGSCASTVNVWGASGGTRNVSPARTRRRVRPMRPMISPSSTSKRSCWQRWRCSGPPPPPGCTTVSDLSTWPDADASTSTTLWMPSPSALIALSASSRNFGVDPVAAVMTRYDSASELYCQVPELNPHIGRLLRDAYRRFDEELAAGMSATREQFGVRPVHDAVLAHLDREGPRASARAERSPLTRQAIPQLVDEPEQRGVFSRRPDPTDGRAKIVQ